MTEARDPNSLGDVPIAELTAAADRAVR
ncbi:MAG: hypothetical protein AVDCRST_MAG40-1320, partial [uncultured Gemmatimonadaceae bacterium]